MPSKEKKTERKKRKTKKSFLNLNDLPINAHIWACSCTHKMHAQRHAHAQTHACTLAAEVLCVIIH